MSSSQITSGLWKWSLKMESDYFVIKATALKYNPDILCTKETFNEEEYKTFDKVFLLHKQLR